MEISLPWFIYVHLGRIPSKRCTIMNLDGLDGCASDKYAYTESLQAVDIKYQVNRFAQVTEDVQTHFTFPPIPHRASL
jgi:hypothetical protein